MAVFTSLSPNTERDDLWLAWQMLFKPWQWQKGQGVLELENYFKNWLPVSRAFAFSSGRACLYAILQAIGVTSGDEVLLQAYTCVVVPNPIIWLGAKPIFVDCQDDFTMSVEDLEKKITAQSKAIIIQHTFGCPSAIEAIMALAKRHNLLVIEDCAHSLGGQYQGQALGAFGDISFFSFGRDKIISSVFGGIVATNNLALAEKIKQWQNNLTYSSYGWILRQIAHPLVLFFVKKTYYALSLGKFLVTLIKQLGLISRAVSLAERQGGKPVFISRKMSNALAVLALHQLKKAARFNAHRQKIAALYDRELVGLPGVRLPQFRGDNVYLRYTICLDKAKFLISQAKKQGIELGCWYDWPVAPRDTNLDKVFYTWGSCPTAEKLAKRSVNLPTNIQTSEKDAMKVVQFIKQNIIKQNI